MCFGCNTPLGKGERILCTVCRHDLPLTDYNFIDENLIDRIFYGRVPIKKANSLLFYAENGIVQQLIHYLKYKNQEAIGAFLGDWFGQQIKANNQLPTIDFIVPVPLHRKRLKQRGYNQVQLFAERLAHHLNTTVRTDILRKTKNTKTQTKKGRSLRWYKKTDLFILDNAALIAHKRILLVDDVITTGATIEACATVLKHAKDVELYIATMAVVP